jgi:phosphatidylinositol alpha-mannosyltransferase
MKIGIFHSTLPRLDRKPGGVDIAVHRLANALGRLGNHEVTVFSLDLPPADHHYRHIHLFPKIGRRLRGSLSRMFVLPALLNSADFGQIDVLHTHGDDWFLFGRRFPIVRTMHGSSRYEAAAATSMKRRVSQKLLFPLERYAARKAESLLVVGKKTLADYGYGQLIDNGVDLNVFFSGTKTSNPTILFVGSWLGRKRGKFLFDLYLHSIRPQIPSAQLHMVCDHCEPADGVTWIQRPDDSQLAQLYRESWVFALPSLYEGFGIPYLEAMASGTVVITSPNEGSVHVLGNGDYGRLVADEKFGDTVIELLGNSSERARLEEAGRRRAWAFSWDEVARRHVLIYEAAIESFKRQRRIGTA